MQRLVIYCFFLFVCIFVGHAVNEINEVLQQICHAQVVIMGQNVTLRDRALWYITSKIGELWHQNSQVGEKNCNMFLVHHLAELNESGMADISLLQVLSNFVDRCSSFSIPVGRGVKGF